MTSLIHSKVTVNVNFIAARKRPYLTFPFVFQSNLAVIQKKNEERTVRFEIWVEDCKFSFKIYSGGAPIEHDQSTRNVSNHDEMILKSFVGNNSILLDCNNSTTHSCAKAKFSVNNFKVGDDTPILIQLDFTINLGEIDKILTDNIDQLVIRPHIELLRYDDEEGYEFGSVIL